jgi:hypothetical protein
MDAKVFDFIQRYVLILRSGLVNWLVVLKREKGFQKKRPHQVGLLFDLPLDRSETRRD